MTKKTKIFTILGVLVLALTVLVTAKQSYEAKTESTPIVAVEGERYHECP